jgi:hypothetical protein
MDIRHRHLDMELEFFHIAIYRQRKQLGFISG